MKHIAMSLLALAAAASAVGQTTDKITPMDAVKPTSYSNPISAITMWADPTAVEHDGRLYVYGSNDQQEYDGNNGTGNNTYGKIKTLVVMSTADMVNWTHHGTIDMDKVCEGWLAASWAPSIVSRVEDDGLTHFYLFFSNSGGGVGVVTSTSPVGPWTSPRRGNLVSGSTPGLGPCSWPFDPGVVIDDNGVGWLTLGGGDPVTGSKLQPGNAHIVKLGKDMVSLDGDFAHIPAPYEFEASELNMLGGKYAYTYCSSWSDRNDWSQYGSTQPAPSTCSMCYMVSDDPMNPDSWQYRGEILANPGSFGYPWGNNHTHMHKFNGKYYIFYHTQVMEKLAGVTGGYRSIAVDEIKVDESTATISRGSCTNSGPSQISEACPNALEPQQIEMMCNGVGVKLQSTGATGNMGLTSMKSGAWVMVKGVDFGSEPVTRFYVKGRGKCKVEVRLDRIGKSPVCTLEVPSGAIKEHCVDLSSPVTGKHNVYLVFDGANSRTLLDEWRFSTGESEGISDIEQDIEVVSEAYYTLDGMMHETPVKGVNIHRTIYSDGSSESVKTLR